MDTPSPSVFGDLFPTSGTGIDLSKFDPEELKARLTKVFKDRFEPLVDGAHADLTGFSQHIATETVKALGEVKDGETLARILAHREAQTAILLDTYRIRASKATQAAINETITVTIGAVLAVLA